MGKLVQLLGLWGPWQGQVCRDMDCFCRRSYGPIRVFFQDSFNWQSEGLFGQSFSVPPPIQALRGLPCLESFLCCSPCQAHRGPPWLGLCSVDWHIRHLKGSPGSPELLVCSSVHQMFDGPASLLFSFNKPKLKKTHVSHCSLQHYLK